MVYPKIKKKKKKYLFVLYLAESSAPSFGYHKRAPKVILALCEEQNESLLTVNVP